MKVAILAGGQGDRLKPLTGEIPKPILPIKSKPFLVHLIKKLKAEGHKEFYIMTGYMSEKIEKVLGEEEFGDVEIVSIKETFPNGTGGALKIMEDFLDNGEFLVVNGDTYPKFDSRDLIIRYFNSDCLIAVAMIDGIDAGMAVMSDNVLEHIEIPSNLEKDVYQDTVRRGSRVSRFEMDGSFVDIGTSLEFYNKLKEVGFDDN